MGLGSKMGGSIMGLTTGLYMLFFPTPCIAANWAQASGRKSQENLIPPSYFTPRSGHTVVAISMGPEGYRYVGDTEETTATRRSVDKMFLLGGDDYNVIT